MTIHVDNLSKKFFIRHEANAPYHNLRDSIATAASSLCRFLKPRKCAPQENTEPFWALKDVSFDVEQGDRLAILGQNGAGKSTLLKILSRISPPTSGKVLIKGKVASLLEVGTGFHPELTGKENIYLNGVLLGMSRKEITNKFEEIIDFADIGPFLDTPVKRYSSGMYVRLAFAVAANLESDILFIDEVLAVGDTRFQNKCIGKMEAVSKQGRTIIFITHHMGSLRFCNKGLLLDKGRVIPTKNLEECIQGYSQDILYTRPFWEGNVGDETARLMSVNIMPFDGSNTFSKTGRAKIKAIFNILTPVDNFVFGYLIFNKNGVNLIHYKVDAQDEVLLSFQPGTYCLETVLDLNVFAEGSFKIEVEMGIHQRKKIPTPEASIRFDIINPHKKDAEPENILFPQWHSTINVYAK